MVKSTMNWSFLINLLRGSNIYETVAKVLNITAGFLANRDADKLGTDDLLAGCLSSVADAVTAYGVQDNNLEGNIVDGLIAGLTRYRDEMAAIGRITVVNSTGK